MNPPICLETYGTRRVAHRAAFRWWTILHPHRLSGPQVGEWTEGCNS